MTDARDEIDPDDAADAAIGGELSATLDPMLLVTSLAQTITPGACLPAFST